MVGELFDKVGHLSLAKNTILHTDRTMSDIYYVYLDPLSVSHISLFREGSSLFTGKEAKYGGFDGVFDMIKKPFARHFMYQTVRDMTNGEDWKNTKYFKKLLRHKGEKEALFHLQKLNQHIEILTEKGYKSQYELGKLKELISIGELNVPIHETQIGMDRRGRFFRIKGGRHRLAVSQHIGIKEMPAILSLYHRDAIQFLPEKRRKITGSIEDFRPF